MDIKQQYTDFHTDSPVIVTGCAGFIGYYTAKALLESGYKVAGIDNLNDYYDVILKKHRLSLLEQYPHFTFYHCDIADSHSVKDIFTRTMPEIVIHLAAQAGVRYCLINPHSYIHSNMMGFMSILESVRAVRPKHTIYASSSSVYGNESVVPFDVMQKTDSPASLYAATKKSNELMAYSYADMYKIPLTGLRFFTVYGAMGRPDMAYFKFTDSIMNNRPIEIYNYGNMRRDFTYIDDIVTGIMGLIPHIPQGAVPHNLYNIGHNHPEKLLDMIEILEDLLGKTAEKILLPMQAGDVYETYADISPLQALIGFLPKTNLYKGLSHFTKWYKTYYSL